MASFFRTLLAPIIILAAWGVIIVSVLAYICPYISPEILSLLPVFGLFYPIIFVSQIVLLPFLYKFKKKVLVYMVLTILAGYGHFSANIQLFRNADKRLTQKSFTLMSYNVGGKNENGRISDKEVEQRKVNIISDARPNILCLQEFYMPEKSFNYPYSINQKPYRVAIFSDYPIRKYKFFAQSNKMSSNCAMYADVVLDKRIMRVFNVHLQSNALGKGANEFVDNLDNLDDETTQKSYLRTFRKLRNTWRVRAKQVDIIADSIAASPYPTIVCGDFNDTPTSYSYRTLGSGLRDAFKHGGRGTSFSYNGKLPALSIDHIFVNKNYPVYGFRVVRKEAADHYPVRVEVGY